MSVHPAISVVPPTRDLHVVDGDGKTCLHHACSSKASIAHAVVAAIVTGGPDMGQSPAHKMHHFYDLFSIHNLHIMLILNIKKASGGTQAVVKYKTTFESIICLISFALIGIEVCSFSVDMPGAGFK